MSDDQGCWAVIFDMDGVLTDSEPLINAAAVAMFKELGLEVAPEDFLPFVGTGENRYLGGVAEKHRFPLDIPSAKRRTYEIYLEFVPERLRAFPGAVELVERCRQSGLKVAVASSADLVKINANLCRIGLPPARWDAIVHGEDVEHKKPAPDIFLAASARLGLPPQACVVIEDAPNGIQAAKAAGMRCVAVAQSFAPGLLAGADLVRPGIGEVTLQDLLGGPAGGGGEGGMPPVAPPPPFPATPPTEPRGPWGFWATMGLGLAAAVAFVVVQTGAVLAMVLAGSVAGWRLPPKDIATNGLMLAVATFASTPVLVGLSWLFAWSRRALPVGDYLGLRGMAGRQVAFWVVGLLALLVALDGASVLLQRPVVPQFMLDAYSTAGFAPLLWGAVVVAAPLGEEVFFRGFLFAGLAHSRVRWLGAILISSTGWSLTHVQYDLYGMSHIFFVGLFLGFARWQARSVWLCVLLHALMNLLATIQVACYLG